MPTEDKLMLTDLECEENGHHFQRGIWQTLHTVEESDEVVRKTTPQGALDDVRCPVCNSLPKDPNA
jgi:hypothetical protein